VVTGAVCPNCWGQMAPRRDRFVCPRCRVRFEPGTGYSYGRMWSWPILRLLFWVSIAMGLFPPTVFPWILAYFLYRHMRVRARVDAANARVGSEQMVRV
jgi:hypothetical protein